MENQTAEKGSVLPDQSENQAYTQRKEGYVVEVRMTGEVDAADAVRAYLRKRMGI